MYKAEVVFLKQILVQVSPIMIDRPQLTRSGDQTIHAVVETMIHSESPKRPQLDPRFREDDINVGFDT